MTVVEIVDYSGKSQPLIALHMQHDGEIMRTSVKLLGACSGYDQ